LGGEKRKKTLQKKGRDKKRRRKPESSSTRDGNVMAPGTKKGEIWGEGGR